MIEYILDSLKNFSTNKLRSGLSSLGIIIGIASVIILLAVGEWTQQQIVSNIQSLGSNLLTVTSMGSRNATSQSITNRKLDNQALQNIKALPHIAHISAEYSSNKLTIYNNSSSNASIIGVTPEFIAVRWSEVEYGIFVSQRHIDTSEKVIVLGNTLSKTLFGEINPLGKFVNVWDSSLKVVGILKYKGQQGMSSYDDTAFIPLTTAQKRVFGSNALTTIAVSVSGDNNIDSVKASIQSVLMKHFLAKDEDTAPFNIQNQAELLSSLNQITDALKMFLGAIAVISLWVGGIGVMNIMLVSVSERTREIGIRRAIGAKSKDIITQFLAESLVICLIGGTIGVLLSYLVIFLLQSIVQGVITTQSLLMSFGFIVFIGLVFGLLPAIKASKLKPIDALRYE